MGPAAREEGEHHGQRRKHRPQANGRAGLGDHRPRLDLHARLDQWPGHVEWGDHPHQTRLLGVPLNLQVHGLGSQIDRA